MKEKDAQPVFSEDDRKQLERDRKSGFSEGTINAGREAQEKAARAIDHVRPDDATKTRKP